MQMEKSSARDVPQQEVKGSVARDLFTSKLGVLAATLGSAVGLGNIWKFPYMTGTSGGAGFILVYILSVFLLGLPVLISEHAIGRTAAANPIDAFRKESKSKAPWWLIGTIGILGSFLILSFYTEVSGWVLAYIPKAIDGSIFTTDAAVTEGIFVSLITNPVTALVVQWLDLAIIGLIISLGISKGIERATKLLLPILVVLLVVVAIRSVTLPGASAGLEFLFRLDLSALTAPVILSAVGLAFFKLSTGMGVMMTYGSYFPKDLNIPNNAVKMALADMSIALLAGIAIFPAVFAMGIKPDAGPPLLFITIPTVFASMPFGQFFMIIFFVLSFIATIGAQVSLVEALVTFLQERVKMSRKVLTTVSIIALGAFGSMAALSSSTLADVKPFGLSFFDLFDFVSSNITLPIGGLFIALFAGWFWGKEKLFAALTNNGTLNNRGIVSALLVVLRFVTPVLLVIVFLHSLKII